MRSIFRALPILAATASATSLCLAWPVFAQDAPPPPPPMADAQHHGEHGEWRKAREERRARLLHDVLNIRADQEAAFQTFLADSRPKRGDHKAWAEHGDPAPGAMTTPERLDRMADRMAKRTAEHQAAFQQRAEAVKRFYAVLSPEQRKAFDALHDMHRGPSGDERPEHGPGGEGGPGAEDHGEAG